MKKEMENKLIQSCHYGNMKNPIIMWYMGRGGANDWEGRAYNNGGGRYGWMDGWMDVRGMEKKKGGRGVDKGNMKKEE